MRIRSFAAAVAGSNAGDLAMAPMAGRLPDEAAPLLVKSPARFYEMEAQGYRPGIFRRAFKKIRFAQNRWYPYHHRYISQRPGNVRCIAPALQAGRTVNRFLHCFLRASRACALLAPFIAFAADAEPACQRAAATAMASFRFQVPESLVVDPGAPVGSVLYTSSPTPATGGNSDLATHCSESSSHATAVGLVYPDGRPVDAKTVRLGGSNIGVQIMHAGAAESALKPLEYVARPAATRAGASQADAAGIPGALVLRLVKLDSVSKSGDTIPAGTLAYGTYHAAASLDESLFNLTLSNSIRLIRATCQTSNVSVNLGTHSASQFKGIGSRTRLIPFSITLRNCPPGGIPYVKYFLQPVTAFLPELGMITGSPAPNSSVVGVQILNHSGNPVRFQEFVPFSGNTASGSPNIDIPFQARYYQFNEGHVSIGTLNASLQFTISYD